MNKMIVIFIKTILILLSLAMAMPFLLYAIMSGSDKEVTVLLDSITERNRKKKKGFESNE